MASGALVMFMLGPSYRIFLPWPARNAAMPSSIVSVSGAACEKGELELFSPFAAPTQFISCEVVTRGNDFATFAAACAVLSG